MNKKLKVAAVTLSSFLLFGSIFTLAQNLYREYKTGDYIKEEDAYFGKKITDPTGLIKASKYVVPGDGEYSKQKTRSLGTSLIGNIESVWDSYTGKGTTIAVIDDGFDYKHPEYVRSDGASAISKDSRYYYANSDGTACLYKNYDTDSSCIAEDWEKVDVNEYAWATHGTNTSTTVAAPLNGVGGVGIAPDADILALKIDMSFVAIEGAIDYAISQNVDVINMSLGAYAENFTDGWGDSQEGDGSVATYLEDVCKKAYNAGIIVVAAAGNESTYHKSYPACNSNVIGVGALGDYDNKGNASKLAEFTNYVDPNQTGEVNVDILAPGYVYTATQSGTKNSITHIYEDTQGTSFSSPIVAGAACLWKQKYPNGTPSQFLNQLQSTADDIGTYKNKMIPLSNWDSRLSDVGPSNITNGRLNVANLMKIDEPFVSVQQTSINLAVNEKIKVKLETANGTITYASSNADVAKVDGNGLIEGVSEGNANIIVTATKNGKTANASVPVKVSPFVATSSLSVDPSLVKLTVGDTYDMEKTVITTPSDASRLFLYESQDDKVASVDIDTGLVTAIGEGTTTIDVIAPYGDGSASLLVTVEVPLTPTTWDKVTSQAELTDGDYLIVYEKGNVAFNGGLDSLDVPNNTVSITISNNKITYDKTTEAAKFTLESYSGGYSIKSSSGSYIAAKQEKNSLLSFSSPQKNEITFSNGNALIASNGCTLKFNNASFQNRFRYYAKGQQNIQLYKASSTSADTLSNVNLTCDKSFHPGESIIKSDIKMSLVYSSGKTIETTEFNFADYMFTYEDALSGGTISKKQFNITYEGKQYNLDVNISRIAFAETLKSVSNVANFIMYEDNANQCMSKLDLAISYLNELSSDEKNNFSISTDYVISTARNRLEAWARHEGKTLSFVDNAFVASSLRKQPSFNKNNEVIVIAILGLATVLAVATGIVLLKRKKEH